MRSILKELGYNPAPYAIADALMYADDRPIVLVREMSLQLTGSSYPALLALWQREPARSFSPDLHRAAAKTPRVCYDAAADPRVREGQAVVVFWAALWGL